MNDMKKTLFFIIIISFNFLFANNIEISDFIKKYYKLKGLDKIQDINDFKISGIVINNNRKFEFNFYFLKPNYYRLNLKGTGVSFHIAYDGVKGMIKDPINPPVPIDNYTKITLSSLSKLISSPLYEYEKQGLKINFSNFEKLDDLICYKFNLIDNQGIYTDILVDTTELNLIKYEKIEQLGEESMPNYEKYSNYQSIDGIRIPFMFEQKILDINYNYQIDSVKFNIGLTTFDFRMPGSQY